MNKILFYGLVLLIFCFAGCDGKSSSQAKAPRLTLADVFKETAEPASQETEIRSTSVREKENISSATEDFSGGRESPFLSQADINRLASAGRAGTMEQIEIFSIDLSAIMYLPGHSYVILNRRILKESDIFDDKELIKIDENKITLKDRQGQEYIVKLKGAVN